MLSEHRFDVVIVGAGPAGSTLAQRLAGAGFHVALVEHQRFPRFKACGEFMSPECLPMLSDLGVANELQQLGASEVRGMILHGYGRRAVGRFSDVGSVRAPQLHGWAIRREIFDDVLLGRAQRTSGVELFEQTRVCGLLRDDSGRVLGVSARRIDGEPIELRGAWTIGADGLRSRVARELGVQRSVPWLDKIALTARYSGVEWGSSAEVHLIEGGFFACTSVEGGLVSLNLILDRERYVGASLRRESLLDAKLALMPALGERLARGTRVDPVRGVGPLSAHTTQQTFNGAALVGDACGYVDPITGEGIFFALKGAEMLAESTIAALHAGRTDRSALNEYLRGRRREIAPREAFGKLLQRGLRHPRIVRGALSLLQDRPELVDVLVSVTGDYVPLRELVRPKLWWHVLGPASRGARVRRTGT